MEDALIMLTAGGITLPYANWLVVQVLKKTQPWLREWMIPLLVIGLAVAEVEAYHATVNSIVFYYRLVYYVFVTVLSFQMHSTNKLNGSISSSRPPASGQGPSKVIDPEDL